jgi:hypothetical protein
MGHLEDGAVGAGALLALGGHGGGGAVELEGREGDALHLDLEGGSGIGHRRAEYSKV